MARPSLGNHRKFFRLMAKLKLPRWGALGVLEALWQPSYECGEPAVGDSLDLAARVGWDGDPEVLAEALLDCGFVDLEKGVYAIHDFWHHAPDYVRRRASREAARREKNDPRGTPPSPEGGPKSSAPDRSATRQCPATDRSESCQRPVSDRSDDGGSESDSENFQGVTGRPVSDRSLTCTPIAHRPSLPVKIPGRIASQECSSVSGAGPPAAGDAKTSGAKTGEANFKNPQPQKAPENPPGPRARGSGFRALSAVAATSRLPRGDPAQGGLELYLCSEFPGISEHQRGLLHGLGLTLQGAYRVQSQWQQRSRQIPVKNQSAYVWRMLETEARECAKAIQGKDFSGTEGGG